jgi:hypothetical protein
VPSRSHANLINNASQSVDEAVLDVSPVPVPHEKAAATARKASLTVTNDRLVQRLPSRTIHTPTRYGEEKASELDSNPESELLDLEADVAAGQVVVVDHDARHNTSQLSPRVAKGNGGMQVDDDEIDTTTISSGTPHTTQYFAERITVRMSREVTVSEHLLQLSDGEGPAVR